MPVPVVETLRRTISSRLDPDTIIGRKRIFWLLLLVVIVLTVLIAHYGVATWSTSTLIVPIVLGGLLLRPVRLVFLILTVAAAYVVSIAADGVGEVRITNIVVTAIVSGIAYALAADRQRLGLSLGRGEAMLLELRDTLRLQGVPPRLPTGWGAEVASRAAGGASFSGDFLVTALHSDDQILEVVIVDVSGKGVDAGNRSLLLSGALGSLLGAVPPEEFLEAANNYAVRLGWAEGFATALHLVIDLTTGKFRIGHAGHPPPAHFVGGSGRWSVLEGFGTVLGIIKDAPFGVTDGELRQRDALLIYTDGLIEVPGKDLDVGIDRLLGNAERIVSGGFEGGADQLIETAAAGVNDDRALMLIWRTA